MATETKKQVEVFLTPEGRLINHSLFEKDQYNDQAVPQYKVEMVFDPKTVLGQAPEGSEPTLEDRAIMAAVDKWGDVANDEFEKGTLILPFLDGDVLARKREAKEKPGDAYKGLTVIRANTIYNKDGVDGPGGIQVFAPDTSSIGAANRDLIYQGCYGVAALTAHCYVDERTGNHAVKFYLSAFQKTRDGDRLVSARDHSKLFRPIGRQAGAEGGAAPARRGRR